MTKEIILQILQLPRKQKGHAACRHDCQAVGTTWSLILVASNIIEHFTVFSEVTTYIDLKAYF